MNREQGADRDAGHESKATLEGQGREQGAD